MYPGISQESESDSAPQDEGFKKPKPKKRGRKPNSTPTTPTPTTPTQEAKRPALDKTLTEPTTSTTKPTGTTPITTYTNVQLKHPTFLCTFTVTAPSTLTRVQLAIKWEEINCSSKDIIIKQESNFLIKTNDENNTRKSLNLLQQQEIINSFSLCTPKSTQQFQTNSSRRFTPSYSVVATGVDLDISDEMFLHHLEKMQLKIRFCKRITSRQRGTPTMMMRLITGELATYEKLITDRIVHFLGRVYRIVESKPPEPIPAPCSRCNSFEHRTEDCNKPTKCNKCQGSHRTSACTSPLPARCTACNAEDHAAWSLKCPRRPTAPIEGIPNVKVKCHNKRTAEVSETLTKESRVHSPITTHDFIINKYKHQINKTNNNNREELLKKLKKQFIEDFNIDTTAVFFGNHMYILMFDLLLPNRISPTEPFDQLRQTITSTEHSTLN